MSATPETLEKGINLTSKREAVSPRGPPLLFLSFQALGIIYSDIGTSPLYVLNGLGPATGDVPPQEDVIGGISAIIWSLTLLPLIKYVSISLRFGTEEGEGGSFALFQGLSPQVDKDYDADRTFTGDSFEKSLTRQPGGRRINKKFRWPMLIWALLGTSWCLYFSRFCHQRCRWYRGGEEVRQWGYNIDICCTSLGALPRTEIRNSAYCADLRPDLFRMVPSSRWNWYIQHNLFPGDLPCFRLLPHRPS